MKPENNLLFTRIFQEYYRRVYNYAFSRLLRREDAEDATAEVFIVLLKNIQSYDPQKGSVSTWVNRIAHNAVEDCCRKAYRHREVSSPADIKDERSPWEPENEVNLRVYEILRQLSEDERSFLALRYEMNMTNSEIAELIGLTPVAVSQRYHRLLEKCRNVDKNKKIS